MIQAQSFFAFLLGEENANLISDIRNPLDSLRIISDKLEVDTSSAPADEELLRQTANVEALITLYEEYNKYCVQHFHSFAPDALIFPDN